MSPEEYVLRSSIPILVTEKNPERTPISDGSGFFVITGDGQLILCTVAHVTDFINKYTLISISRDLKENGQYEHFNVGPMVFYDLYDKKDSNNLIHLKRIDCAFVKIEDHKIIDFVHQNFTIFKLSEIEEPAKGYRFYFKGSVKFKDPENGIRLSQMHIETDLEFKSFIEEYYIFKCTKKISDEIDYQGCSGAPVIEETGKLVGAMSEVVTETKFIKVLPIQTISFLINKSIKDKLL